MQDFGFINRVEPIIISNVFFLRGKMGHSLRQDWTCLFSGGVGSTKTFGKEGKVGHLGSGRERNNKEMMQLYLLFFLKRSQPVRTCKMDAWNTIISFWGVGI